MIVLSMEQSDTTRSSGFIIAEAERRFRCVSISATPMASVPGSTGSRHGSTRTAEQRISAEKSGVGAVSIRRREAVVPS